MGANLPPSSPQTGAEVRRAIERNLIRSRPPSELDRACACMPAANSTRAGRAVSMTSTRHLRRGRQPCADAAKIETDDGPANGRGWRFALAAFAEAGVLDHRQDAGVGLGRVDPLAGRHHRVGLDGRCSAVPRVVDGGIQEPACDALSPRGFGNDEAEDGPDWQVVEPRPNTRVLESVEILSRTKADPTDRPAVAQRDQAGRDLATRQIAQHRAVPRRGGCRPLLRPESPERAPAPARIAALVEELLKGREVPGAKWLDLDLGSGRAFGGWLRRHLPIVCAAGLDPVRFRRLAAWLTRDVAEGRFRPGFWGFHQTRARSAVELIRMGTLDAELAALVWLLVEARLPLIVAARAPRVGKSTTLNALLDFLPPSVSRVELAGAAEDRS